MTATENNSDAAALHEAMLELQRLEKKINLRKRSVMTRLADIVRNFVGNDADRRFWLFESRFGELAGLIPSYGGKYLFEAAIDDVFYLEVDGHWSLNGTSKFTVEELEDFENVLKREWEASLSSETISA